MGRLENNMVASRNDVTKE